MERCLTRVWQSLTVPCWRLGCHVDCVFLVLSLRPCGWTNTQYTCLSQSNCTELAIVNQECHSNTYSQQKTVWQWRFRVEISCQEIAKAGRSMWPLWTARFAKLYLPYAHKLALTALVLWRGCKSKEHIVNTHLSYAFDHEKFTKYHLKMYFMWIYCSHIYLMLATWVTVQGEKRKCYGVSSGDLWRPPQIRVSRLYIKMIFI